jgi:uncharacterized protein YjiS (DUF1127 family)
MTTTFASKCTVAGAVGDSVPRRTAFAAPIITSLVDLFSTWLERVRERRQLHTLDDRMLKDIGLTRADVEYEAQKRFWMR